MSQRVKEIKEAEKDPLLYIGSINPGIANGSTIHFFSLGKELSQQGVSVDLVIPKMQKGCMLPFADLSSDKLKIYQKGSGLRWRLPPSLNLIIQIPWILSHIYKKKIRRVYIRSNITSFLLVCSLRIFTRSFIITEHNGLIDDECSVLGYPRWIVKIAKLAQTLDAKMAHLIRVVTPGLKKYLISYGVGKDKIFVASNGTNIARMFPVTREQAVAELNLQSEYLYIGFAGNLVVWQGLKIAMEAFAKVSRQLPNVRLIIAGDGPEKSTLKLFARALGILDNVQFLNHVPIENINMVINVFDVCIAPFLQARNSKIGLSPIKIRDYAAVGRPVVAANINGITDEYTHKWLITHKPDDADDLAQQLIELLQDKGKRNVMSKAAREYAEKNYQWSVVVKKILYQIENYSSCVA